MTNYQLQIKSFVFGPFETNCYVVTINDQSPGASSRLTGGAASAEEGFLPITNDQSPMVLLIDPACAYESEQQQLLTYIENQKSPITNHQLPITIVATHGHLDHLWGAAWACAKWNTPVLMHEADIPMAKAMQQQYDLFGIRAKAQPFPIEDIKSKIKNQKSQISNFQLLETPGHTPGSICLYFHNDQLSTIITGDTLFKMGYGRTDLPGGNYSQLMNSLDLLLALPPETGVYPGHGEPTTIAAEARWCSAPLILS